MLTGDLFGKDATIPASQINYKIQTRTRRGDAVAGRDHIYLLPPLSVRVLSLVQEVQEVKAIKEEAEALEAEKVDELKKQLGSYSMRLRGVCVAMSRDAARTSAYATGILSLCVS